MGEWKRLSNLQIASNRELYKGILPGILLAYDGKIQVNLELSRDVS